MGNVSYNVFDYELDVWYVMSYTSIVSLTCRCHRTVPFTMIPYPYQLGRDCNSDSWSGKRQLPWFSTMNLMYVMSFHILVRCHWFAGRYHAQWSPVPNSLAGIVIATCDRGKRQLRGLRLWTWHLLFISDTGMVSLTYRTVPFTMFPYCGRN